MADNRIFNVNGRLDRGGEQHLPQALSLAFAIRGSTARYWHVDQQRGLVLEAFASANSKELPVNSDATQVFPLVLAWIQSDEAKVITCTGWDANADHDGHNGPGWRVYCEDWGRVGASHGAIVAVKRCFMWYGK